MRLCMPLLISCQPPSMKVLNELADNTSSIKIDRGARNILIKAIQGRIMGWLERTGKLAEGMNVLLW